MLVSGGTSGLGAAIARAAAREGALVAVTGRRREPGEALAAELAAAGSKALFIQADVADTEQARASVTAAVAHRGVLGQDRDALLPLQVAGVEHALGHVGVGPERAGLPQHGVDQRGLAVVDVRDDGHVAQVVPGRGGGLVLGGHA